MIKSRLEDRIFGHGDSLEHDEAAETHTENFLISQIIEVERAELLRLWRVDKISLKVKI